MLSIWKRALGAVWSLSGCSKGESRDANVVTADARPEYLQLRLEVYGRSGLATRIHLRFAEGDDSYNYINAGQAFVGLFRDRQLAEQAKALVAGECRRLSGILKPASLAEAMLRPENSASFMEKLVKGEKMTSEMTSPDSVAKLIIACGEPSGSAWRGDFEFKSPEELDNQHGPLLAACIQIGDTAAAAANFP